MDSNIMDIKGVADYLQIKEQTVYRTGSKQEAASYKDWRILES